MTEDPQLQNLMDYTKFHIGVYLTMCTGLIAALELIEPSAETLSKDHGYLWWTLAFFLGAGAFGGLVGSNIPYCKTFDEFKGRWVRAFGFIPIATGKWCTHLEHACFWIGIMIAVVNITWG